jgi:hypothetical protein
MAVGKHRGEQITFLSMRQKALAREGFNSVEEKRWGGKRAGR